MAFGEWQMMAVIRLGIGEDRKHVITERIIQFRRISRLELEVLHPSDLAAAFDGDRTFLGRGCTKEIWDTI